MKAYEIVTYSKGSTAAKGDHVGTIGANRPASALRRFFGKEEIARFDTKAPNYCTLKNGERAQAFRVAL